MNKLLITACLVLTTSGLAQAAKMTSTYTSIEQKDCKVISSSELETEPEIDHLDMECPGAGGYQVAVSGGDIRYPLFLISNNLRIQLTNYYSFHQVASNKIEWRGIKSTNGKVNYKTLIYRMGVADQNGVDHSELLVVKLAGLNSCIVGKVLESKNMNEKARKIADVADQLKCINKEQ
jgi:hypothetical protein